MSAQSARIVDTFSVSASSPNVAIDGAHVYVANQSGVLIARDVLQHATRWQAKGQDPIVADSGRVFSQGNAGTIVARDGRDGRVLWRSRKLGEVAPREAFAAAGSVYVAGNDGIAKLDERTGHVQWIVEDGFIYSDVYFHNGMLLATSTTGSPIRNTACVFDVTTGVKLASAFEVFGFSNAAVAGYDADGLYVYAISGTATIEDGQYVAARISRIALATGRLAWTADYRPDPLQHLNPDEQTAKTVLATAGRVILQLEDKTYVYQLGPRVAMQTPLAFEGLGTPFYRAGELFTVDEHGLNHVRIQGRTAIRQRVADFAIPSADFLRYQLPPQAWGAPVVTNDRWLLAADGQSALVIYDMANHTGGSVSTPCVIIGHVGSAANRVALSCIPSNEGPGPAASLPASIVTLELKAQSPGRRVTSKSRPTKLRR